MTEAGNLNDFFSAHKKKDKKKRAAKTAAAEKPAEEETKAAAATPAEQPVAKEADKAKEPASGDGDFQAVTTTKSKKKTSAFDAGDSSEEEGDIVLRDDLRSKLKEKKDVDAVRRNEEERKNEKDGLGWGFGGKRADDKPKQADS